jgi:hypothetical protein
MTILQSFHVFQVGVPELEQKRQATRYHRNLEIGSTLEGLSPHGIDAPTQASVKQ